MSGHNKWSTIKNKKAKTDAAKGKIFTKIGREIVIAVKTGGSGDPNLNSKLKDAHMDELFQGILSLSSVEECYNFFEDLCTITELRAMAQRFQVAKMLDEGQIYSDIVKETGASTATISRVNKCLIYGTDGYRMVLDRTKTR